MWLNNYIGFLAIGWISCCIILCLIVIWVHINPSEKQKYQAEYCAFGWWFIPSLVLCLISKRYNEWSVSVGWPWVISVAIWCTPFYAAGIYAVSWSACNSDMCAVGLGDFVIGWFK